MDDETSLPRLSPIAPLTYTADGVYTAWSNDTLVNDTLVARLGRRLATPAALLALCALAVAFFWRVVVLRQILLPSDVLYAHDPLWRALAPPGFTMPANGLDSDALTEFYPWTALAADALHHGTLPLWNPYAFAGTPFLAAMQTAVFSPVNLALEWALSPADILGARALVYLVLTLTGTFLFARRLTLSRPAALLTAIAFGLGLPYIVWIEHPMGAAVAWLPWLLLLVDGAVASRGGTRPLTATALVVALEILSGHGESTAHILLLCLAYALFRTTLAWRREGRLIAAARTLLTLAAAAALGAGIAAAHLIPSLAQIQVSEAAADRARDATTVAALGEPAHWATLVVAVVPDLFGNPTWGVRLPASTPSYNEVALYVGALPLLLAALALARRKTPYTIFFGLAALVALGMAVRLPVFGLLDNLPGLRVAANGRLRIEYAFAVAVLAGYGLDTLAFDARDRVAWVLTRLWPLGAATLVIVGVGWLLNATAETGSLPLATVARMAVPVAWLALFACALWLCRRGVLPAVALPWTALLITAADLFLLGLGYHATVPRARIAVTPPAIQAVRRDRGLYRVVGLGGALLPSTSSLYGLQDVRGYDPAYASAYERYFTTGFGTSGMRLGLGAFGPSPAAARSLDLMNVRYVFAACDVPLNPHVYQPVYRGDGCVYHNTTALPRAFLVHDARWATATAAARLLARGTIDPRRTALLDPTTDTRRGGGAVEGRTNSTDAVRVASYGLNTVKIIARSATPAILVLGDTYAPGWRARVDGRPAPIIRADADFRAVVLAPGAHRVSFDYAPDAFRYGVAVSVVALALWATLLLVVVGRGLGKKPTRHLHRELRLSQSPNRSDL